MEVTALGIAVLISKVAAVYGVSIGITSGMQYYHDFKLSKKKTRRGGGASGDSDFNNTITRLRSDLHQSE